MAMILKDPSNQECTVARDRPKVVDVALVQCFYCFQNLTLLGNCTQKKSCKNKYKYGLFCAKIISSQ